MEIFRSFRARVTVAFASLTLGAVGLADWQAASASEEALRAATMERLRAIRETKRRQIEDYFRDSAQHVLALSSDEAVLRALGEFRSAWAGAKGAECGGGLREFYAKYPAEAGAFPDEAARCALQEAFLARNPHPLNAKDLLVDAGGAGEYGRVHARYHPTFHRYRTAFGFYDIFLIDAREARVVYSVRKEIDFLARLDRGYFQDSGLARAYARAMNLSGPEQFVVEDYSRYAPSHFAPAAFVAAPVWIAGARSGVLAIQISIDEVNAEMTGGRNWKGEGLGETGQAYLVGRDGYLRSDMRLAPELSGLRAETVERVRRDGTAVLNLRVQDGEMDAVGRRVLRSSAPVKVQDVNWFVRAEMTVDEALAPVAALRKRIWAAGAVIALLALLLAWLRSRTVTKPVIALAKAADQLGRRNFSMRVPVTRSDEIGDLERSFNRMADDLERTTVSRDELERLSRKLITAQEEERSRIARELHDDVSQRLAAMAIDAGRLKLGDFQARVAELANDVHGLSRRLHPSILKDLGLVAAIETEARGLFDRDGPPVHVSAAGNFDSLGEDTALCLYRVAQEALQNAYKHAGASQVSVTLARERDRVRMLVEDDGRGFDRGAENFQAGLGLASMRERVELVRGKLGVDGRQGSGTRIEVEVPAREE